MSKYKCCQYKREWKIKFHVKYLRKIFARTNKGKRRGHQIRLQSEHGWVNQQDNDAIKPNLEIIEFPNFIFKYLILDEFQRKLWICAQSQIATDSSHSVFQRFRQAKFAYDGSIFRSSQYSMLTQRPLKVTLALKVVKIDSKIIIQIPGFKLVKQIV